ncbi:hypothetical protein AB0H82_29085 [Streptomyces sp. NPDC050732]
MTRASAVERQGRLLDHLDQCAVCQRFKYCPVGRLLQRQVREARGALRPM